MSAVPTTAIADAVEPELRFRLAGVDVALASDFAPFLDYARVHLQAPSTVPAGEARIRSWLEWHEGSPPERQRTYPELSTWNRVDRDLYRNGHQLMWFRVDDVPDLHLRFSWDAGRLSVHGRYYHRLSKTPARDMLQRVLYHRSLPDRRRRRFTTLLYYLAYYPCFWQLEHHADWHPLHAGGVELREGVVVLAGPSGVGKSTLVAGLAAARGAQLLSDTFLLQRDTSVRAVFEPLLLDSWSRSWLGSDAALLRPIQHPYTLNRRGFHWPGERLSNGGRACVILFPQRAPQHYVRRVDPIEAQGRIRAGDLIVNDLRRYWAFASVLELLGPTPLVQAREQALAQLVASVPCYEIGLTSDVVCSNVLSIIDDVIHRRAAQP